MLNGRRVGGWITSVSRYGEGNDSGVPLERLMPIVSVSGMGIEPELIPLNEMGFRTLVGFMALGAVKRVGSTYARTRSSFPS
jgi:hypothetical protein